MEEKYAVITAEETETVNTAEQAAPEVKADRGSGKPNFQNKYILLIVRTAAMLAVTVFLQWAGTTLFAGIPQPFNTMMLGSIVNMCIYIAGASVGLIGGAVVAFCTPLFAFIFGHLAFPVLMPFIGLANYAMVVGIWAFLKFVPRKWWTLILAIIVISTVKFLLMYALLGQLLPFLLPDAKAPQIAMMQTLYSYPQLVAAVIGGGLFVPVAMGLKRAKVI